MVKGEAGRKGATEWHINERNKRERYFRSLGVEKVGNLSQRELFLVGLSLYWAEGAKTYRRVLFSNSDPAMIKIFVVWLKSSFDISISKLQFRLQINVEHEHRLGEIESYWLKLLGIDRLQLDKPNLIRSLVRRKYAEPEKYFGLLNVRVRGGTNLSYEVLGAIDRLRKINDFMVK